MGTARDYNKDVPGARPGGLIGGAALVAVALALAQPCAAAGGDDERARAHVDAAVAYFDEGDFASAVHELDAAYRLHAAPELQYNLGECYEKLGRLDEAAAAYQKYLGGSRDARDRSEVVARIAAIEQQIGAAKAGAAPPPPPVEKVVFKTVVIYRAPPPPPGRGARWAGFGVGALAVGALASGIATAALAARATSQVNGGGDPRNPMPFDGAARDAQQTAHTDWIIAGVSFGVAALAAAGSAALFLVARRVDREAPKVTLAPLGLDRGAGLFALGRF